MADLYAHCPNCNEIFRTDRGFDGERRYHCYLCGSWYDRDLVDWKPVVNNRAQYMRAKMAYYERLLLNNTFERQVDEWEQKILELCANDEERIMLRCLSMGREFTNTMFDILTLPEAPDETS